MCSTDFTYDALPAAVRDTLPSSEQLQAAASDALSLHNAVSGNSTRAPSADGGNRSDREQPDATGPEA